MSKIFSVVGLETNTGIQDGGLIGGIPDREDVEDSDLYRKLVEDCGGSEYINVTVSSYCYGEGESENTSEKDLKCIKSQSNFENSNEVTFLQDSSFTILYPDQGRHFI